MPPKKVQQQAKENVQPEQVAEHLERPLKSPSKSTRAKREQIVILSTGLKLLIPESSVAKVWHSEKPKAQFLEFLTEFVQFHGMKENFESVELNIIAEFHLFNLIFAKQELYLNDYKSAVLLNIFWTLLINNNLDYKDLAKDITEVQFIQQNEVEEQQNQQVSKLKWQEKKSLQGDVTCFKKWLIKHVTGNPPLSIKVFDTKEMQKIVKHVSESYFKNFNLYRVCLNDKNKNEEIRIHIYVDYPSEIPPLKEALYMGRKEIEVNEGEDEEEDEIKQKAEEDVCCTQKSESIKQTQNTEQEDPEERTELGQFRKAVKQNIGTLDEEFSKSIMQKDIDIDAQYEEIVNPKKKK